MSRPLRPTALLPRERAQGWQRWQAHELALDAPAQSAADAPAAAPVDPAVLAAQREAERAAAREAELEQLRETARAEGYAAGHAQGYEAGHADGLQAGHAEGLASGQAQGQAEGMQAARVQAEALAALLDHCHQAANGIHEAVPASLVRLALSVAGKVIGSELRTHPESVVRWVEDMLHHEPVTDGVVKLHLHPDDATLVAAQLGAALTDHQWRLVPDDAIGRGGCRLVTPLGELDATLQTRWQRACVASGLEPPWTLD